MTLSILLAEDDEDDAYFLLRAFERAGGEGGLRPAVTVARDGQQALGLVFDALPGTWSLVMLDLKMPRLNGLEVLKAIRESPYHRGLHVVIFTASDEPSDREEAARLGATRYLRKPADTERFVDVARQALQLARDAIRPA